MPDIHSNEGDFLRKITRIIEENISNAQFGVSELARETGMSRSNLLRKVKGLTKISVSQFIRQVRLKHGLEMLRQKSYSVSEVSYMVGFGSTSYFVKCFREYYGYPPGEVGKRDAHEDEAKHNIQPDKNRVVSILGLFFILVIFAVLVLVKPWKTKQSEFDKSIAVLPFHNDSDDSSNIHIINGLMEAVLTNLQQIEDLKVVSRTSAEKYRNNPKIISEIAKELNVSFIVEGSGQKIGDKILLNIQLIEAGTDTHLWAKQYNREAKDIFALQSEVAKNIANEIQVIITPEEEERINKVGTQNLVAYDLFLKGLDLMYKGGKDNLEEAIKYYELAILEDNNFARANAGLAITYFFLDANQVEKRFSEQINSYADKALLLDPQLAQSLIAKALYYMNNNENELALPYLETALRYNPNSALIINILADYYTSIAPNTEKYLEYALKGIQLDIAANDSATACFTYLHISNALIQSGFINEAITYIDKSLQYNHENIYSEYVKAFILYARDRDLIQLKDRLIATLQKDTNRLDVLQEVGKINYYLRDYESSYLYYEKYSNIKNALNLNIYPGENAKIGLVLSEIGLRAESEKTFSDFKDYADEDNSIYKHLSLAVYYSYNNDIQKAIKHLEIFSEQDNYHFWTIIFLGIDPLVDNMKDLPEFKEFMNRIELKFWENHKHIKARLEEKNLLQFK